MELSSSDKDNFQLEFWNNWSPLNEAYSSGKRSEKRVTKKVFLKTPRVASIKSSTENSCISKWIPPVNFLKTARKEVRKIIPTVSQQHIKHKKATLSATKDEKITEIKEVLYKKNTCSTTISWRKTMNLDWGKRVLLHDVVDCSDGELIWGIVNLGIFANIKLWVNEYGNVSGLADGKVTRLGSTEMTYICITNSHLLRKMLNLSSAQWASLCETVQETKATLKFSAFQDCDLIKSTHLEKLWFFICKRRHCLPPQCMLVKICGAIKCIRKFKIISKLVVQDIRSVLGEPIL